MENKIEIIEFAYNGFFDSYWLCNVNGEEKILSSFKITTYK